MNNTVKNTLRISVILVGIGILLTLSCAIKTDTDVSPNVPMLISNDSHTFEDIPKSSALERDMDIGEANASFIGENSDDYAGVSVTSVGDVNADGYNDFLIGANGYDAPISAEGKVYLFFGNDTDVFSRNFDLSKANASFVGEMPFQEAGDSIAGVGDVNNDTYDDFLIGAYGFDEGKAYLIFGNKTDVFSQNMNLTDANVTFIGEHDGDGAGSQVTGAGDVNNDGYDDFLISSIFNSDNGNNAGKIYLLFGNETETFPKIIPLKDANASFLGEASGDHASSSISSVGDVNGDGYDDILFDSITASYDGKDVGKAYLIFGNKTYTFQINMSLANANVSFYGEVSGDRAGKAAGAGDVNGDGYDDILVGAGYNSEGGIRAGQTYLLFGNVTHKFPNTLNLTHANASFIGENSYDNLGNSVSSAGDVNGDGYDDFLIGAYNNSDGGNDAGKAYLIYGNDTNSFIIDMSLAKANASFIGEDPDDRAGYSVASAGDVNNDGLDDFLIGAYQADDGGNDAGKAYLFFGPNDAPLINTPSPSDNALEIGTALNLQISVSDANHHNTTVYFYDNTTGTPILLGTDNVFNGGPAIASLPWSGLAYNTTYKWFAVASDGIINTTTATFSFTTRQAPPNPFFFLPPSSEGGILGYSLLILLPIVSISITIIARKLRKS